MAREYLESLKVGDEVSGVVISQENDSGQIILSLKRAADDSRWKSFEEAHENGTTITVKGREVNKSGLLVDAEGLVGLSHLLNSHANFLSHQQLSLVSPSKSK